MTPMINVERISAQRFRVSLVADIQISPDLTSPDRPRECREAGGPASPAVARGGDREHELLTVEETAEILHISRDTAYSLIRTGQLRSISRAWITEFVEHRETAGA